MVDLHCHLLPELDDGAGNLQDSIQMLEQAAASGITDIVATPHVGSETRDEYYALIGKRYETVKAFAEKYHINLYYGAEIFHSTVINEQLKKWPGMFLDIHGKYVLVETSFMQKPLGLKEMVFELNMQGIRVVFAHPERYLWLTDETDLKDYLVHSGVLFQLDAGSLNGTFSNRVMRYAWEMIDEGLAHFVASDAHNTGGRSFMEMLKAREQVLREKGIDAAELLFEINPRKVLNGEVNIRPVPKSENKNSFLQKVTDLLR